jgi:hypothetical protein
MATASGFRLGSSASLLQEDVRFEELREVVQRNVTRFQPAFERAGFGHSISDAEVIGSLLHFAGEDFGTPAFRALLRDLPLPQIVDDRPIFSGDAHEVHDLRGGWLNRLVVVTRDEDFVPAAFDPALASEADFIADTERAFRSTFIGMSYESMLTIIGLVSTTFFLDELADMSQLAQAKILRAVEYGEFERLGSERMLRANAHVISATNCSLRDKIREGKFRLDLFHRLSGLTLVIPALRDRAEELPSLIAMELKASAAAATKKITAIHPEAMKMLMAHEWRGNLRELKHMVRTMALFCQGPVILPEHVVFPPDLDFTQPVATDQGCMPASNVHSALTLAGAVRHHIRSVYEQNGRNQRRTAKHLGISRATLARHLQKPDQK